MGTCVAQLVKQFFPGGSTFNCSPEVKTRKMLKDFEVISNGRVVLDAGSTDLTSPLMAIQKTLGASGRHFTYTSGRMRATGHADLALALLHAPHNKPLESTLVATSTPGDLLLLHPAIALPDNIDSTRSPRPDAWGRLPSASRCRYWTAWVCGTTSTAGTTSTGTSYRWTWPVVAATPHWPAWMDVQGR